MNIKKTLASVASYALVGAVALGIGGTLATNQDTAADENVFTSGDVDIIQNEYQRDENGEFVTFKQFKSFLPAMGETAWDDFTDPNYKFFKDDFLNAQDKIVTVKNVGQSEAYVRTVFAFECGDMTWDEFDKYIGINVTDWNDTNNKACQWDFKWVSETSVEIKGVKYMLAVADYVGTDGSGNPTYLKSGVETAPSLREVYLASSATNEISAKFNGTYDILVATQAVQVGEATAEQAWTYAFGGDISVTNYPWLEEIKEGYEVSNDTELAAAIAAGETEIWLNAGEYNVANCGGKTLTINGSKNAVLKLYNEGEDGADYGFGAAGTGIGNITFNGVTVDTTANTGNYKGYAYMKATFNDCNFVGAYCSYSDSTFNNCTFDFKDGYFWTWGAENLTFDSCTFNGNSKTILAHGTTTTVININDCTFAATEKGYTGSGYNTAVVEIDPAGNNTYTINFTGNNTKTDSYAGWYRVKDNSTGHTINGVD